MGRGREGGQRWGRDVWWDLAGPGPRTWVGQLWVGWRVPRGGFREMETVKKS